MRTIFRGIGAYSPECLFIMQFVASWNLFSQNVLFIYDYLSNKTWGAGYNLPLEKITLFSLWGGGGAFSHGELFTIFLLPFLHVHGGPVRLAPPPIQKFLRALMYSGVMGNFLLWNAMMALW